MKIGSNIRLRVDGRYEARYFKGKTEKGNNQYGCVYGTTPEEADRKRTELLCSLQGTGSSARLIPEKEIKVTREKKSEPLDEKTARSVEKIFSADHDGAAFGFSLCLHMGLSHAEVCALKYSDFDFDTNSLTISRAMSMQLPNKGEIFSCDERKLPIPDTVRMDYNMAPRNRNCFVLTDTEIAVESVPSVYYLLRRILKADPTLKKVQPDALQMTFIRRAVESGLSSTAIESITGIEARTIERRFRKYIKPETDGVIYISEKYKDEEHTPTGEMNLLILGAGSHGQAVYEIAEKLGVFQKIRFLDDHATGDKIIGRCSDDLLRYRDMFSAAFIAIGDNATRKRLSEAIIQAGYTVPRIISNETSIAKNVTIGAGSVVMPQATLNADAKIGKFAVVESNALVGYRAEIGDYAHLSVASVVMKDANVPEMTIVDSGEIIKA